MDKNIVKKAEGEAGGVGWIEKDGFHYT